MYYIIEYRQTSSEPAEKIEGIITILARIGNFVKDDFLLNNNQRYGIIEE